MHYTTDILWSFFVAVGWFACMKAIMIYTNKCSFKTHLVYNPYRLLHRCTTVTCCRRNNSCYFDGDIKPAGGTWISQD